LLHESAVHRWGFDVHERGLHIVWRSRGAVLQLHDLQQREHGVQRRNVQDLRLSRQSLLRWRRVQQRVL